MFLENLKNMDLWCQILGIVGLAMLLAFIICFFWRKLYLDRVLVYGFTFRVVIFVILCPFMLTFGLMIYNQFQSDKSKIVVSRELVNEPDIYVENEEQILKLPISYFEDSDNIGAIKFTQKDSIYLLSQGINIKLDGDSVSLTRKITELDAELKENRNDPHLLWTIYYHFIDPGNQHMTVTSTGRIVVLVISLFGVILLNGVLVTTLVNLVDRRREKWLQGKVRYNIKWYSNDINLKDYVVIVGGNEMVPAIVKELLEKTDSQPPYILILTRREVEEFRRELELSVDSAYVDRIVIYSGDCTSVEDIKTLRLDLAKEVYILGEDISLGDNDSYHDTLNIQCLQLIAEQCKLISKKKLVCRIMFEYQTTFSVYQITGINTDTIDFRPFNYYELWAQKVLINKNDDSIYLPLEGKEGIKKEDNHFVHLVVVGMSRMGIAMAIEAAHLAHYPNFEDENGKKIRTRITFIDSNAKQEMDFFMGRFKEMFALARWRYVKAHDYAYLYKKSGLKNLYDDVISYPWHVPTDDADSASYYKGNYLGGDFIDIEWEFIDGSIEQPSVQEYIKDAAKAPNAKLTVAVCFPETNRSIAAAIYLPYPVYEKALQVLVYQRHDDSLINTIASRPRYHGDKIKGFGMLSSAYDASLIDDAEFIGKEVGEEYQRFTEKLKNSSAKSQISKGKTESAMLWSNYYNANMMWTKLRCVGYSDGELTEEQVELLAKVEHNRWNVEQLLLRYHPLKEFERNEFAQLIAKEEEFLEKKNDMKRLKMAHLDICSNDSLKMIDGNMPELDKQLIRILPQIYKELEDGKKR